jgi:23S rRNA pseudouridine1911/1915/1917 synthase
MYVVQEDTILATFLLKYFSKKEVKALLKNKCIFINGKKVSQYNFLLKISDQVSIIKKFDNISILYEDKDLIIVDKPFHLLTISDQKEKENTLYHKVSTYVKEKNKNNRIFIVHRLDYETGGLVVFAKNKKAKVLLQENWSHVKRGYQAVVHGTLKSGKLTFYLKEGKNQRVYVTKKEVGAKEAITQYEVMKSNKDYSLLKIEIETGKKHQIRVSFKEIGHPIVGDKKYGIKDSQKQMCLLANEILFSHPITKKQIHIFLPTPNFFSKLVS